jgi:hypothetical protein
VSAPRPKPQKSEQAQKPQNAKAPRGKGGASAASVERDEKAVAVGLYCAGPTGRIAHGTAFNGAALALLRFSSPSSIWRLSGAIYSDI